MLVLLKQSPEGFFTIYKRLRLVFTSYGVGRNFVVVFSLIRLTTHEYFAGNSIHILKILTVLLYEEVFMRLDWFCFTDSIQN